MENTSTQALLPVDWSVVVRQALVLAVALIAYSVLIYVLDINMMSISAGFINFLLTIALGAGVALMTVKHQRSLDGGFIRFGRALLVGFATAAGGLFISGFWNYILVKFIDPDYPTRMKEQMLEAWGEFMPPEALEEMERSSTGFEKMANLGSTAITSFFVALFFGLICGLIAAAIGRRNPKPEGAA